MKKSSTTLVTAVLLSACLMAASGAAAVDPKKAMKSGDQALAQGRTTEALGHYEKVLAAPAAQTRKYRADALVRAALLRMDDQVKPTEVAAVRALLEQLKDVPDATQRLFGKSTLGLLKQLESTAAAEREARTERDAAEKAREKLAADLAAKAESAAQLSADLKTGQNDVEGMRKNIAALQRELTSTRQELATTKTELQRTDDALRKLAATVVNGRKRPS